MKEDNPLKNWNDNNKENTLHGFVSALYLSVLETGAIIDKFSTWLLAGTGATGALLITQIKSVLPYLTQQGFRWCLALLIISALFGFIAKYYSILCQIQTTALTKLPILLQPIFDEHSMTEDEIQEIAEEQKINIDTAFDLSNAINEFKRPFSRPTQWLIARSINKTQNDRQAGYHIAVKRYNKQAMLTIMQSLSFAIFLALGGIYAQGL